MAGRRELEQSAGAVPADDLEDWRDLLWNVWAELELKHVNDLKEDGSILHDDCVVRIGTVRTLPKDDLEALLGREEEIEDVNPMAM